MNPFDTPKFNRRFSSNTSDTKEVLNLHVDKGTYDWSNEVSNYRTIKQGSFDPYDIKKPKLVKQSDIYFKENLYNPVL